MMQVMSSIERSAARPVSFYSRMGTEFASVLPVQVRWLFLAWVLYSAYVFLHAEAAVPDELNFLEIAKNTGYWTLLSTAPPALYGSLFWIGLKLTGSALVARLLLLVMFVLTPYLVLRTIATAQMKLATMLLWLTFPIAWWAGKLIAPEIPTMFLVALAVHALHRNRMPTCAIALGAAVGIKVSALPILGFFFFAYLLQPGPAWKPKLRSALLLAAIFIAALLVSCPPIFQILQEVGKQPGNPVAGGLVEQLHASLLVYRWEWDTVFSGGVLRFSLMPIPLALAALCMAAGNWRIFAALLPSLCGFLWMSLNSSTFYGWYWITVFPVVLYAASRTTYPKTAAWMHVVMIGAAAINGVQQLPLIVDQMYQKIEQIRVLEKRGEIAACIEQKLHELKPASVYNLAEFGMPVTYPAKVATWPDPVAYSADVQLVGTRHMLNRRTPSLPWPHGTRLYGACDAVLIFTRQ